MTRREKAYRRKVQELLRGAGRLRDSAVRRTLASLETARVEVAALVASTDWQATAIPALKEAIGRAVDGFKQRYMADQAEALANSWRAGIDAVDSPLQYAGIAVTAPEISLTALEIAQGYSADLIGGLTADAVKKINGQVMTGIMGQQNMSEVMKAIGRDLKDKGTFSSIAHRAETITRTELAKVQSLAREARIQAVVEGQTEPQVVMMKEWVSSGKAHPREHHASLHGVRVPVDQDFPGGIPYPHAPGLPASETINCGCTHVLVPVGLDELPKQYEPVPYEDRAIYD